MEACRGVDGAVEYEERRRGEYGSYQRKERRIILNSTLPTTEKATTLAHELAHHLLHAGVEYAMQPCFSVRRRANFSCFISVYTLIVGYSTEIVHLGDTPDQNSSYTGR